MPVVSKLYCAYKLRSKALAWISEESAISDEVSTDETDNIPERTKKMMKQLRVLLIKHDVPSDVTEAAVKRLVSYSKNLPVLRAFSKIKNELKTAGHFSQSLSNTGIVSLAESSIWQTNISGKNNFPRKHRLTKRKQKPARKTSYKKKKRSHKNSNRYW